MFIQIFDFGLCRLGVKYLILFSFFGIFGPYMAPVILTELFYLIFEKIKYFTVNQRGSCVGLMP